jgi:hypothetical protein
MTRAQAFNNLRAATKRVNRGTSIALWACLCTTIALFVTSAYWPPKGSIDPSMFSAAGFLFGFATLFVAREAILEGFGIKLTHGNTTIEMKDQDGKQEDEPQTHEDNAGD